MTPQRRIFGPGNISLGLKKAGREPIKKHNPRTKKGGRWRRRFPKVARDPQHKMVMIPKRRESFFLFIQNSSLNP
jgi:hypothetical protein